MATLAGANDRSLLTTLRAGTSGGIGLLLLVNSGRDRGLSGLDSSACRSGCFSTVADGTINVGVGESDAGDGGGAIVGGGGVTGGDSVGKGGTILGV